MEIDFAMVADAAISPGDGKLYIHGGAFDTISSTQFPCSHPQMFLVIRLLGHRAEADLPHSVIVRLMDSDGRDVIQIHGAVQAQMTPGASRSIPFTVVADLKHLTFERPGEYSFEILLDGRHVKSLPLRLLYIKPMG